jgi:hypothetical protein
MKIRSTIVELLQADSSMATVLDALLQIFIANTQQ